MPPANKPLRDEYLNRLRSVVQLALNSTNSSRWVAERAGVSHSIVCRIRKRAAAAALDWATVSTMPTVSLYELLARAPSTAGPKRALPDFEYYAQRLGQPGMTRERLYGEYRRDVMARGERGILSSRFNQLLAAHRRPQKATMKQRFDPGYRMEIDFSGDRPWYLDKKGKRRSVELLCLVLPFSGLCYACCLPSQSIDDVIAAVLRGLRFLGGAPAAVVPDNFAAAVVTSGTENLRIQPDFLRFAEAHNMAVLPARPYSPTHKGTVENQVRRLQEYLLPELALRTYRSREAIEAEVERLMLAYNDRPLAEALLGTRRSEFDAREQLALQALPQPAYVHRHHLGRFKVPPNHCVRVLDNFYSVPYHLVGQYVHTFVVDRVVEIVHEGDVVATHDRVWEKLEYLIKPEHQKPSHRAQAQRDRPGIEAWAEGVGPKMAAFVRALFASGRVSEQNLPGAQAVHSAAQGLSADYLERVAEETMAQGLTQASDFNRNLRLLRHDRLIDPLHPKLLPRAAPPLTDHAD